MEVIANRGDRRVGCNRVDPVLVRHFAAPAILVPIAALEPLAFRQGFGRGGDALDEFPGIGGVAQRRLRQHGRGDHEMDVRIDEARGDEGAFQVRSEEHTSELQSLMRISYAVFCLKKKRRNEKYRYTT